MRPFDKIICPDEVSMSFIRTLKPRRKSMRLTQKMLAENLGITASAVSCYESGKALPTLPVLMKLAAVFGADLSSSVNWKYYHGHVSKRDILSGLKRYGFTYSELGELLGYDESAVREAVNFRHGFLLECLSRVLDVIDAERVLSKFRSGLLRRGGVHGR